MNNKEEADIICHLEAILQGAKVIIKERKNFSLVIQGLVPKHTKVDLNQFLNGLLQLKFEKVRFNKTKISIIAYSAARCNIQNDTLSQLFNFLADIMKNDRLLASAGSGIIALCTEFSDFVVSNFDNFMSCKN